MMKLVKKMLHRKVKTILAGKKISCPKYIQRPFRNFGMAFVRMSFFPILPPNCTHLCHQRLHCCGSPAKPTAARGCWPMASPPWRRWASNCRSTTATWYHAAMSAGGIEVDYSGRLYAWQYIQWKWDGARQRYLRFQFGGPDVDADSGELVAID